MNLQEFSGRLITISSKSGLNAIISEFINSHNNEFNHNNIKNDINGFAPDKYTLFGNNLGYCRKYCSSEKENEENKSDVDYLKKIEETIKLLESLSQIYQEINNEREAVKKRCDEDATIAQQRDVLREINFKIKDFKTEIETSKDEIKRINESFDNKLSSILINTVAILGIFVAIAFAGFGVTSIISNIEIQTALVSEEAFVKNIFFLLLASFLCYNLLLLLVYFIFKLSRPLFNKNSSDENLPDDIKIEIFIWIDAILGALTAAAFLFSIWYW